VHGHLLSGQGKFAEAAAQHARALAIRERISPTSYETSRSLNALAYAYDELGRYAEARALAERALAVQIAELGPGHPDIALCYNNLGNIASDEGDLARASDYYRRALAIREKTVPAGDDPSGMGDVLNNLGIVAFQQGRLDEAVGYHRRALEVREKIGPDEPDISASLGNLAVIDVKRGRIGQALAGYRRALAIAEKALGRDHPYVGDALQGIGECTWRLGKLADSEAAYQRALAIRQKGARPIELGVVEFGLARTAWQRGQKRRALELVRAARGRFAGDPAARSELAELEAWQRSHLH
jgi:tetratricopeptide (TPR) repeat protein